MLPVPLMFITPFSRLKEIGGRLVFVGQDTFKWTPDMLNRATFPKATPFIRINNHYNPRKSLSLRDVDMSIMSNYSSEMIWSLMKKMEAGPVKVLLNKEGQLSVIRWLTK